MLFNDNQNSMEPEKGIAYVDKYIRGRISKTADARLTAYVINYLPDLHVPVVLCEGNFTCLHSFAYRFFNLTSTDGKKKELFKRPFIFGMNKSLSHVNLKGMQVFLNGEQTARISEFCLKPLRITIVDQYF